MWGAILGAASSLLGGALSSKAGKDNAQVAQGMSQADRDFAKQQAEWANQQNRPTQVSDFGTLSWSKDANGNPVQTNRLNDAEASRLNDFRQIAANRMRAAGNIGFAEGPMNYEGAGMGHIANMAGFGSGTSGQRGPMPTGTMGRYAQPSGGGMMMGGHRKPMPQGGGQMPGGMGQMQPSYGPPPIASMPTAPAQTPRYGSQATPAPVNTMPPPAEPATPPPAAVAPEIPPEIMAEYLRRLESLEANQPRYFEGQGGN